jgi:outer membrane lipoprotein LolB
MTMAWPRLAAARWARGAALLVMIALAGCATAPKPSGPADAQTGPWSGRLALNVEDKPGDSFSAGFELRGSARAGELTLYSPLGGTLALLAWEPGAATLRTGNNTRQFPSVDALVAHVTGAAIPVAALFDWLRGLDTHVAGWTADLSQLAQGRLAAKRVEPRPEADLRLVLER